MVYQGGDQEPPRRALYTGDPAHRDWMPKKRIKKPLYREDSIEVSYDRLPDVLIQTAIGAFVSAQTADFA